MKQLVILLILAGQLCFGQSRFDQPVGQRYTETYSAYTPVDREAFRKAAEAIQKRADDNAKYKREWITYIDQLISKENDPEFTAQLTPIKQGFIDIPDPGISQKSALILDLAKQCTTAVNQYYSQLPAKLWERGNKYYAAGQFQSAKVEYDRLHEIQPKYLPLYFQRAVCLYKLKQPQAAIDDFDTYLSEKNDSPEAWYWKSYIQFDMGDHQNAMKSINHSIELNANAGYYFHRARIKSALGDYYGSITDNSKCIELDPNSSMAYNNRGWDKFELKQYKEALLDFDIAILKDNTNAVAYDSRAETKYMLGNYSGSMEDCTTASLYNSKMPNPYLIKGKCFHKQGQIRSACEQWSKSGELGATEAYDLIKKYCK